MKFSGLGDYLVSFKRKAYCDGTQIFWSFNLQRNHFSLSQLKGYKVNFNSIADFPFRYNINTRWNDMDSFGHVNNAVFLTYIEDARTTFFKRWKLKDQNKSIIVACIKMDYLRQIKHPSKLIIGSKISRIGNSSFDILSGLFVNKQKRPSATSLVACVCYNYDNNQAVPVYDEIKNDYIV